MKHDQIATGKRKSLNLSIDTGIVAAAREAGINLSQVSEKALAEAARVALDSKWQEENRAWIESHRKWVEENELPLEKYRMF